MVCYRLAIRLGHAFGAEHDRNAIGVNAAVLMQRFSLCVAGTDEPFAVIARSDSDAAILFIPLLEKASSLSLLAMTTGLMLVCHRLVRISGVNAICRGNLSRQSVERCKFTVNQRTDAHCARGSGRTVADME
jgi:hypothetical protein